MAHGYSDYSARAVDERAQAAFDRGDLVEVEAIVDDLVDTAESGDPDARQTAEALAFAQSVGLPLQVAADILGDDEDW